MTCFFGAKPSADTSINQSINQSVSMTHGYSCQFDTVEKSIVTNVCDNGIILINLH